MTMTPNIAVQIEWESYTRVRSHTGLGATCAAKHAAVWSANEGKIVRWAATQM